VLGSTTCSSVFTKKQRIANVLSNQSPTEKTLPSGPALCSHRASKPVTGPGPVQASKHKPKLSNHHCHFVSAFVMGDSGRRGGTVRRDKVFSEPLLRRPTPMSCPDDPPQPTVAMGFHRTFSVTGGPSHQRGEVCRRSS